MDAHFPMAEVITKSRVKRVLGQRSGVLGADLSRVQFPFALGDSSSKQEGHPAQGSSLDLGAPASDSSHVTARPVEHVQCTLEAYRETKTDKNTCVWSSNLSSLMFKVFYGSKRTR